MVTNANLPNFCSVYDFVQYQLLNTISCYLKWFEILYIVLFILIGVKHNEFIKEDYLKKKFY